MHECAFALLSLSAQYPRDSIQSLAVTIYTDQPQFFRSFKGCWLPLRFRETDARLIAQWKGKIDFVHRVKIEVLRDFIQHYEGQVLYVDTDVHFQRPVDTLFDNIRDGLKYMHIMEDIVHSSSVPVLQKLSAFLRKNTLIVNGEKITVPDDVAMWNAGVLGFSSDQAELLDKVLYFTDAVYPRFSRHVIEQFAFSLYFRQPAPLLMAHSHIAHYWNLKELRPVLASFFHRFRDEQWDRLVTFSSMIQLTDYMQQKANFYSNRSLSGKLLKQHWKPRIPDWNLLMQQL